MTSVVLMYHRVDHVDLDPYGLAVEPTRFSEHMTHLQSTRDVVPLEAILSGASSQVAITFDDGYVDNLTNAAGPLGALGLPSTFFITTGQINGRSFWWDDLAEVLLGKHELPPGADIHIGGARVWLSLRDPASRAHALRFVHRRIRALPPAELEPTIDALHEVLGVSRARPADRRPMTATELVELAQMPNVNIGAHTRSHPQLAIQPRRIQRDEIMGSVDDLAALLGRDITSFAYPFGNGTAVGRSARRLARKAGCRVACTTEPTVTGPGTDPLRIPRINVGNWTGAELAERLDSLGIDRRSVGTVTK